VTGELDELVALAAHGNAFLAGGGDAPELLDANSTFRFVRSVEFVNGDGPSVVGTATWLTGLRDGGTTRLAIDADSIDPHFAAFANAGRWWLVASSPGGPVGWRGEWTVVEPHAPDHRIWAVTYRRLDRVPERTSPPLDATRLELQAALEDVLAFCAPRFDDNFREATAMLDSPSPTIRRLDDLLPERGYGLAARQLLAAASSAWVFGGMGSWNDLVFDDPESKDAYGKVSARLFDAVLCAAVAATNSFDPAVS